MPVNPFDPVRIQAALGGRYQVLDEIRVGGQGAVFRAVRMLTLEGRSVRDAVALKLHLDPKQDVRVEREIRAMEVISHPCLSRLIEHGFCDFGGVNTRYIAWEFIDGAALDTRLASGPLTQSSVAGMTADVCSAIAAIWKKRIVEFL